MSSTSVCLRGWFASEQAKQRHNTSYDVLNGITNQEWSQIGGVVCFHVSFPQNSNVVNELALLSSVIRAFKLDCFSHESLSVYVRNHPRRTRNVSWNLTTFGYYFLRDVFEISILIRHCRFALCPIWSMKMFICMFTQKSGWHLSLSWYKWHVYIYIYCVFVKRFPCELFSWLRTFQSVMYLTPNPDGFSWFTLRREEDCQQHASKYDPLFIGY